MSEFLPESVLRELAAARGSSRGKRSHMKLRTGGQEFTILRYWNGGFALDASDAPPLRGLVDVYESDTHICRALIVTSAEGDGERVFDVKLSTPASGTAPPADFVRERPEPAGLLPKG